MFGDEFEDGFRTKQRRITWKYENVPVVGVFMQAGQTNECGLAGASLLPQFCLSPGSARHQPVCHRRKTAELVDQGDRGVGDLTRSGHRTDEADTRHTGRERRRDTVVRVLDHDAALRRHPHPRSREQKEVRRRLADRDIGGGKDLLASDRPPQPADGPHVDLDGEPLAVDKHPIAIEDDQPRLS